MQNLQDSFFMLKRCHLKFFNLQDFIFKAWFTLCFNYFNNKTKIVSFNVRLFTQCFIYDLKIKHFMFRN